MGGMGGAILTGIFANDAGLIYSGSFLLLGKQIVSAFSAIAFSAIGTSVIVLLMKLLVNMRVAEDTESAVDERMHGETYHRPARAYNPKEDLCMHSPVKAYQRPDIAVGSSESTSSAV